jgi:hypothetical protein
LTVCERAQKYIFYAQMLVAVLFPCVKVFIMSLVCLPAPGPALLLATAFLGFTTVFAEPMSEPLLVEAEEFASPALVRIDESASGGAYVSRMNADGDAVGRMLKFPLRHEMGKVRIWARGRLFKGALELRSNEAELEQNHERTITPEMRRTSTRLKMEIEGDSDTWVWIDLGVHDLTDSAAIVPWAHEDPGAVPESGLDCMILSTDLDFDPTAQE